MFKIMLLISVKRNIHLFHQASTSYMWSCHGPVCLKNNKLSAFILAVNKTPDMTLSRSAPFKSRPGNEVRERFCIDVIYIPLSVSIENLISAEFNNTGFCQSHICQKDYIISPAKFIDREYIYGSSRNQIRKNSITVQIFKVQGSVNQVTSIN